jgi:ABC-type spermidine/putrescine transport system permease subunit I
VASIADRVNATAEKRAGMRVVPPFLAFLPITLVDFFFFVLPMLIMSIVSVMVIREFHITPRLTAENYLFFLKNPLYLKVLAKSLLMALATTVISIILAFPFAAFLTRLPRAIQRTMLVLVILPFWTSYLLRVYAWMTILGERGLINRGLMDLGIIGSPIRLLLYNDYSVVLVAVYLYIPYAALALYTNLERLDTSLIRAAMDLGARPIQVFVHIVLPLMLPGIFASFIFVFIPMLGEYVTPAIIGGAHGLMIVNVIVSQIQALRFGIGSAMVFVLVALILLMVMALRKSARLEKIYGF